MSELKNRVALVTGGSRGIGRAVAIGLASAGVHVAIGYVHHDDRANETLRAIADGGGWWTCPWDWPVCRPVSWS